MGAFSFPELDRKDYLFFKKTLNLTIGGGLIILFFLSFFVLIFFKNLHPFDLSIKENYRLFMYNSEVLIWEFFNQNHGPKLYINRHEPDPIKIMNSGKNWDEFYNHHYSVSNIEKRNNERKRDLEILKIGLKLMNQKGEYVVSRDKSKIDTKSNIAKNLAKYLYSVPYDPNYWIGGNYYYQSDNGLDYTLEIYFEKYDRSFTIEKYSN